MDNIISEILKEGINIPHKCGMDIVTQNIEGTSDNIQQYKTICKVCGKVEKTTITVDFTTYDEVCLKFHGEVI